jgi:hypothetical protein
VSWQSGRPITVFDVNKEAVEALKVGMVEVCHVHNDARPNRRIALQIISDCRLVPHCGPYAIQAKGAKAASSVGALAKQSEAIITMLPATQHVREVMEGTIFSKARCVLLYVYVCVW